MREFFRGWRRKIGCVTLLMACVLTCGWLRSFFDQEHLTIFGEPSERYAIHSRDGRLYWMRDVMTYGLFQIWSTSYESIVIPLTVLSAVLLLWPQRKRQEPGTNHE